MATDAEQWFADFRNAYDEDKQILRAYRSLNKADAGITPRTWTSLMLSLLERIGREEGFLIKREPSRVDMTWTRKGNTLVAIEHENDASVLDSLNSEIEMLLLVGSPLKILITYLEVKPFRKQAPLLVEKLQNRLKEVDRFDFEFLLVIGQTGRVAGRPEDEFWVAYRFYPQFGVSTLAFP